MDLTWDNHFTSIKEPCLLFVWIIGRGILTTTYVENRMAIPPEKSDADRIRGI